MQLTITIARIIAQGGLAKPTSIMRNSILNSLPTIKRFSHNTDKTFAKYAITIIKRKTDCLGRIF